MVYIYSKMMDLGYTWEDFKVLQALGREALDLGLDEWSIIKDLEDLVKSLPEVA